MKRQHLPMIVSLPIALAFACAANAQQTPQTQPPNPQPQPQTQQNAPMQNQPMQQTVPATSSQTMQCAAGTNCYDNNTTDRDSNGNRNGMRNGTRDFSTLAGSKGYVTQADTSGHRWLAHHFNQCDSNHDGKLTQSEYNACRIQH